MLLNFGNLNLDIYIIILSYTHGFSSSARGTISRFVGPSVRQSLIARYFFQTNKASSTQIVTVTRTLTNFLSQITSYSTLMFLPCSGCKIEYNANRGDFFFHQTYLFMYKTKRQLKRPACCVPRVYQTGRQLTSLALV